MQEQQRILIADDEPEIREVLRMMLGSEGYEILEAVNAQEAVEQAERVDLVILDIMMPGESGIQACTRIREKTNVPILFLTAKSGEHDKVIGFSAGGDAPASLYQGAVAGDARKRPSVSSGDAALCEGSAGGLSVRPPV